MVTCLYDMHGEFPINYNLNSNLSEMESFKSQLVYVNPGDVLVLDRYYFNYKLLGTLIDADIHGVFRLKEKFAKKFIKNRSDVTFIINDKSYKGHKEAKFRIIKFTINDKQYYIGTTLLDVSTKELKEIYAKRWLIETHFNKAKYTLNLGKLESTKRLYLEQDLESIQFIFLINSYLKTFVKDYNKTTHIINDTISLHEIMKFIPELLYKDDRTTYNIHSNGHHYDLFLNDIQYISSSNKVKHSSLSHGQYRVISGILKVLRRKRSLIPKIGERHYPRIRLFPHSKWRPIGKRFSK
jgi:hypothetical protein